MTSGRVLALLAALLLGVPAGGDELVHRVGRVVMRVDRRHNFPGGALLVRASSGGRLGGVSVVLDGRRVPLSPAGGVMRALVPIPLGTAPGDHTLGFEIAGRRGVQRVPLTIGIVPRSYPPRAAVLPLAKHALVASPEALRDGRRVLLALRATELGPLATGPLRPPVGGVAGTGFGGLQTYAGIDRAVELLKDALFGEQHRGLDYDVPVGTAVTSPAAGRVLLAGWLAATGWTVLVDHGAGLVSALFHLSAVSVREGDLVFGGGPLGRSGEAGLASHPHVHWGVYLHGVAVDPAVVMQGFES